MTIFYFGGFLSFFSACKKEGKFRFGKVVINQTLKYLFSAYFYIPAILKGNNVAFDKGKVFDFFSVK